MEKGKTAAKKKAATKAPKSAPAKAEKKASTKAGKRFLGWQDTPIHQATFGGSTKGGSHNMKSVIKHSTGSVKTIDSRTYLLDAAEAPIGRLATTAASLLMGKHRETFTPSAGSLDSVVVINADKSYFTSNKADKKVYYWHSMWMGGLKNETAKKALDRRPEWVLWQAVQGMLPKNKISRYALARLKIYKGAEHPHQAQKPILVTVTKAPLKKIGVA